MDSKVRNALLAGGAAGLINGLLGGGGGTILVPVLRDHCALDQRRAFATSVAVIFPLCLLSSAIYLFRGTPIFRGALPYLLGGAMGGFLSGKFFRRLNMDWLRRLFAVLILFGGLRSLLL